jgi:hypothetical protein
MLTMDELLTLLAEPYNDTVDYLKREHPLLVPKFDHVGLKPSIRGIPGLSKRKTHELSQLIPHILQLIKSHDVEFIIDVGSGKSYLSRYLSRVVTVICIEKNQMKVNTARRLDRISDIDICYINNLDQFNTVERFILSKKKNNQSVPNSLIVGLDICGDLLSQALKFMVNSQLSFLNIVGTVVVPCCFHKVTELLTSDVLLPPYRISDQDLRFLSDEEIQKKHEQESSVEFHAWTYEKGWLSRLYESLVLYDLLDFLKAHNYEAQLSPVFKFSISSRNMMIKAISEKQ